MKKVFFTLVAVAAVALVSCTGKEKAAENAADSAVVVEETTVIEEETVTPDSTAAAADSTAAAADTTAVAK